MFEKESVRVAEMLETFFLMASIKYDDDRLLKEYGEKILSVAPNTDVLHKSLTEPIGLVSGYCYDGEALFPSTIDNMLVKLKAVKGVLK